MMILIPAKTVTFSEIQVGRKFKTSAGVTYQKTSTKIAKPLTKSDGVAVSPSIETTGFFNSRLQLTAL
jgi:hypothetical protein